ncbi:MAG: M20/M25/M40 family metallo-hydrolase [Chloroflexi bacterium]|nr:M20/M25/M40 family metallo-hydrolase [Chloroflexota bacterium]MCC6892538.1 M20/M25/M40 family metallo-hydrolase [Anaerolineae bacterium]
MKQQIVEWNKQINWDVVTETVDWIVEKSIAIQQIPAPTFSEEVRAKYVAEAFRQLGLQDIQTDSLFNVVGLMPGKQPNLPGIMVSAHTDTVFAQEADLTIRREKDLIYGPGLGDNSVGVGGMLGLALILNKLGIQPDCDIWFVANTREEGLGDLGGMKAVFQQLQSKIKCVINLEGMAFGHVYHAGIAVRRLHITAKGEGGHSWLNFGRTSAIHGILDLGAQLTRITPPETPRTTYNVGIIEGGQSINTISTEAGMWLDLRSEESSTLSKFEQDVRKIINKASKPNLPFHIEIVGDRPAGSISPNHELVQSALLALEMTGVKGTLENGSTDANVPLAAKCPAVTIGITRGSNAHRMDEYIEVEPIRSGMQQLVLLTLATAGA